ncbi:MAG: transglycosylase SLT domain-containing protein, partial [Chloroflexota bacterium]
PQDDLYARALFWLARCREEAGAHMEAITLYEEYMVLGTPLAPYAQMRKAAQLQAIGELSLAAEAYEAVAQTDIARGDRAGSYEKAIALRRELGQNDLILDLYTQLLELAEFSQYRTRILAEAIAHANQQGAVDQARGWQQELAEQVPETPQALDAVSQLVVNPQSTLSPAIIARVYDVHGQYEAAIPYYDTAVVNAEGDAVFELRRLRALALRSNGDFAGALEALAAISAEVPESATGRQAELDWIQTRGQSGETEVAIEGYRTFAETYPDDPLAPEALQRVSILQERLGDVEGAFQQRLDLGRRYPTSEQAHNVLYSAGWHFYNSGRNGEAQEAWTLLSEGATGSFAAQGAFWAARVAQETGQSDVVQALMQRSIDAAPDSYYGARAAEELGLEPEGKVVLGSPITDAEWQAAETWLASWSSPTDSSEAVPQHNTVLRASLLVEVGLQPEAIAEWNEARTLWRDDPASLYQVARAAYEQEVPYIALKTTEELLTLAPDDAPPVPQALKRLLFPVPYSTVALEQAREFDVDPRVIYALMRQESLFNPGATSWVGARGLAQVMPATGQGIAQNLNVGDFQESDLYRLAVSIRFGTFYFSYQVATMNGSIQAALSAYNGGPGNAQRWAGGTTVADPDLFTESIDYGETRHYVRLVYGYYGTYQRLYALP